MKISEIEIGSCCHRWTALEAPVKKDGIWVVRAVCECGTKREVRGDNFAAAATKSCGCLAKGKKKKLRYGFSDVTPGARLGNSRLVVKSQIYRDVDGKYVVVCTCDCGKIKVAAVTALTSERTRSCGCYNSEVARTKSITHGDSKAGNRSRIYSIWANMKTRCGNKNVVAFSSYGGSGITVCDEWQSYEGFKAWAMLNGYKDGLTIDRKKNNLGYCPENCRWATYKQQSRNRDWCERYTAFGETKILVEWSEDPRCKVCLTTLQSRLKSGWPVEEAIASGKTSRWRRNPTNG